MIKILEKKKKYSIINSKPLKDLRKNFMKKL
jgi:hypothetical protein